MDARLRVPKLIYSALIFSFPPPSFPLESSCWLYGQQSSVSVASAGSKHTSSVCLFRPRRTFSAHVVSPSLCDVVKFRKRGWRKCIHKTCTATCMGVPYTCACIWTTGSLGLTSHLPRTCRSHGKRVPFHPWAKPWGSQTLTNLSGRTPLVRLVSGRAHRVQAPSLETFSEWETENRCESHTHTLPLEK